MLTKLCNLSKDLQIRAQLISFFSSNLAAAINFLTHLLIIRSLSVASYGEYSTIVSLPGIFYSFLSFIPYLIIAAVKGIEKDEITSRDQVGSIFKSYISISFYWTLLLAFFTPFLADYLHLPSIEQLLLLLGTLFIVSIFNFFSAVFQALGDFRIGFANFAASTIKLICIYIGFKFFNVSVWIPLVAEIACFSIVTAVLWKTKKIQAYIDFKNAFISPVKSFPLLIKSKNHILNVFILGAISTIDIVFCRKFLSLNDGGIVIGGINLAKILFFFSNPINLVLFYFSKNHQESNRSGLESLLKSVAFCGVGLVCGSIFLYSLRNILIQKLYGASYFAVEPILLTLLIYVSLIAIDSLIINFLMSVHSHRFVIYVLFSYFAGYQYLMANESLSTNQVIVTLASIAGTVTSLCLIDVFLYYKNTKKEKSDYFNSAS